MFCLLLGVIALACAGLKAEFSPATKPTPLDAAQRSNQFENATLHAYDRAAKPLYSLNSPEVHYDKSRGFEFEAPQFAYQGTLATPMELVAERGTMESDAELLQLLGEVELLHFNHESGATEHLQTRNATVDLQQKNAYTDERAVFRQHHRTTAGTGVVVDLETQTVQLQSNVRVLHGR